MKRLLYILMFVMALVQVSCVREDFPQPAPEIVPDGYTKIEFAANIAEPKSVTTRAVDPDGLDVNNMTLFCFNEFGLFISTETATLDRHTNDGISDSGVYKATVPSHTRIIHFLANHSEGLYDESNFPGQTEAMVIANMEGGSGMLVYWSRFEMDAESNDDIKTQQEFHITRILSLFQPSNHRLRHEVFALLLMQTLVLLELCGFHQSLILLIHIIQCIQER